MTKWAVSQAKRWEWPEWMGHGEQGAWAPCSCPPMCAQSGTRACAGVCAQVGVWGHELLVEQGSKRQTIREDGLSQWIHLPPV